MAVRFLNVLSSITSLFIHFICIFHFEYKYLFCTSVVSPHLMDLIARNNFNTIPNRSIEIQSLHEIIITNMG